MGNIFGSGGSSGGGSSGGSSGGGSSSGGSSSGGSSGGGGSSSARTADGDTWKDLTAHQRMEVLGRLSDIMFPLLGRKPSMQEAAQWYAAGLSTYATQMKIQMSKAYRHSADFKQKSGVLQQQLLAQFGGRINVKPKLMQSWIAHGYTADDVQAWMYRHPQVFRQSNIYADRYQALADQWSQTLGYNWDLQDRSTTKRVHVDTNKKKKGIQGQKFVNRQIPTAAAAHLDQAAFHFQDPQKYRQWLMKQPEYRAKVLAQTQAQQQQSNPINQQGRPQTVPAQAQPDVGA